MSKAITWDKLEVGSKFRWLGGTTIFVKVDKGTCKVLYPIRFSTPIHPSWWEMVIPV